MSEAISAPAAPSTDSARLWYAEALRETVAEHTGDPTDAETFVLTRAEIRRAFELMTGRKPEADADTLTGRLRAMRSMLRELRQSVSLARCDAQFVGRDDVGDAIGQAEQTLSCALSDLDRSAALLRQPRVVLTAQDRAEAEDPRA